MNWHEVIDERSYEMHQVIAEILRADPDKLEFAVAWIEKFLADTNYWKECSKYWTTGHQKLHGCGKAAPSAC
jgi:hypothetical protein